jgi:hypothetical protein
LLLELLFFSPAVPARLLFALFALAFSLWRCAACALLAFLVPVFAAPRLPLLRVESLSDKPPLLAGALEGDGEEEFRDAMACSLVGTGEGRRRTAAAATSLNLGSPGRTVVGAAPWPL